MKKHLTLIGINYFPEDSAIGLYSTQMSEYLAANGYLVEVITGFPYYPQWVIRKEYQTKPRFFTQQHGSIKIHRYRQFVPKTPTFLRRILHMLDFTFGSIRNVFKIKKCDLVIAIVPFTATIIPALLLARMRRAKLWVHVQDFEFDAARESGLATGLGSMVFGILIKIEAMLLRRADIVSTISHAMLEKLRLKTTTPAYFLPNWIDANDINPATAQPHPYLTSEKFKILYSGNIGAKQDWEFFIRVAEYFNNNAKFAIIIVGDGAGKADLVSKTAHISNLYHYAPIEYAELASLLCSADLHILFQKGNVLDTVMPSKILGMMASAKPSIVTGNPLSETKKLFTDSQGGYFFASDDFAAVTEHIQALQKKPQLARRLGFEARKYIIQEFDRTNILEKFTRQVEKTTGRSCHSADYP